jgi:hypothetical protein
MTKDALLELVAEIHRNVDRVCLDLEGDRPELANALRAQARAIPRPEELVRVVPASNKSVGCLGPLLYDALDEGIVDARQFDALMLARARAERILVERQLGGYGVSVGSPSDS